MEILKNRTIKNGRIIPIEIIRNDKNEVIRVTEDYIDITYKSKETESRVLSNLYPYKFKYLNDIVSSIESVIQSLKYKDELTRKACFDYFGIDAWHLRGTLPYEWQKDGILYASTPLNRFSEEYQLFLDELYYCAFQNLIYRNNLILSSNKDLDHTIGEDNNQKSTLTRTEYISRLYGLRYCALNQINEKPEVIKILSRVREELI